MTDIENDNGTDTDKKRRQTKRVRMTVKGHTDTGRRFAAGDTVSLSIDEANRIIRQGIGRYVRPQTTKKRQTKKDD
jgi:hypothetical protein